MTDAPITLEDAIDQFVDDFLRGMPKQEWARRQCKADYTAEQLACTDREQVLDTMLQLMRGTMQALIRQGKMERSALGPGLASILELSDGEGERELVARYLAKTRSN